jgi:hypothetical protein
LQGLDGAYAAQGIQGLQGLQGLQGEQMTEVDVTPFQIIYNSDTDSLDFNYIGV